MELKKLEKEYETKIAKIKTVKNRFNNDPLKLIAFIKDNGNLEYEDLVTGFSALM